MFKGKKNKSDDIADIKPVEVGISYITKLKKAVSSMLESGEIKSDDIALYYLVAINSDSLIILFSSPFIEERLYLIRNGNGRNV